MTPHLRVLRFNGLHPDTLGHFLAALGLLAAVGQRWPDVRGCWRGRRFLLLHESLTEQPVKDHLLDTWRPTRYERWWGDAQKADTKAKSSSAVWRLRNSRSVQEVQILECHLVGLGRNQFNPVFGKGGTLGQRDFADVWCECLKKARPAAKPAKAVAEAPVKLATPPRKKSKAQLNAEAWLDAVLSGNETAEFPIVSAAGTWFVFANKSFNTGQVWSREGRLSPWLFLLAAEGALLLGGDVNRRLSMRARPYAVFPFVCDPAQPTTAGEVGMSKEGEFWAPLWDCPATVTEVRHLLKRGLARLGHRAAHAPHEFAVAALAAGTDAGVAEFVRFDLRQTTSAKVYEAVPQEHIAVSRPDSADSADRLAASTLLSSLIPWLNRLPFEPRDAKQRGRFRGLRGPVEAAIIRVSERPDEAERWQHLLLLLSRQQARMDRNRSFRETFPPLPWLHPDWFTRAWPDRLPCPDEILLARAIASIGAGTAYPLLPNLFGIDLDSRRRPSFAKGDRPPRVVWNDAEPLRMFGQVLSRRLLDAGPGRPLPLGGTCLVSLGTVARLLSGDLDLEQVAEWVLAFSLIEWTAARPTVRRDSVPFAGELLLWGLFRPIFHENPHSLFEWLPGEPKPALARRILNLIQFGNLEEAIRVAECYYQAAGRSVVNVPGSRSFDDNLPGRLAAALLVPARSDDMRRGLRRWLVPEKVNPT